MKSVYCIMFGFNGYEGQVLEIYEEKKNAIKQLVIESRDCGYDNVVDFMNDYERSLVEWVCGTNEQRVIPPSYDW